jgi:hypothetical protein
MLQRRAKKAGITTAICNHSWRATGITNFLENGGAIEMAQYRPATPIRAPTSSTIAGDSRRRGARWRYERKPGKPSVPDVPEREELRKLRMPVMLDEHDERAWIGGVSRDVAPLIAPFDASLMHMYPVSPQMNSSRFESPSAIEPVGERYGEG